MCVCMARCRVIQGAFVVSNFLMALSISASCLFLSLVFCPHREVSRPNQRRFTCGRQPCRFTMYRSPHFLHVRKRRYLVSSVLILHAPVMDLSFSPSVRVGSDGAIYTADWQTYIEISTQWDFFEKERYYVRKASQEHRISQCVDPIRLVYTWPS
ncbi:hypothetical protein CSUI_009595 [Cystoisospora suis]|uniref:Transmembrane protein n=1 Tax=Cystoisospora suis TaxID=483139 RepID=A0A2C6KGC3_9APIC|nr:hypothetical protein CSUI_009595 [Cystoisospora suis]